MAPDHDGPTLQTMTASYVYPYGLMFTMTTTHQLLGPSKGSSAMNRVHSLLWAAIFVC
ncbi:hypothetical protein E2C01_061313 [Portunus trituberculatus]|uniref:Uncharacterized protein n=1 Tax=Portunus trituberculatus TaxID=210409 RepID=A0A5B7HCU6_PORTR|nr:hypothetical protein [Portunus trituberculatus]